MNAGKITEKIFDTAKELVGWIPGGLGHANVVASIIFAGMSGSAVADAGGLGAIEMEAMKKNGYDEDFAGAVTAASSVIGPIFPPSIPLIIYGSVASVSVDQLFMGGVVPGLLMGVLLMVMVLYFAIVRRYERHPFRLRALDPPVPGIHPRPHHPGHHPVWLRGGLVHPYRGVFHCGYLPLLIAPLPLPDPGLEELQEVPEGLRHLLCQHPVHHRHLYPVHLRHGNGGHLPPVR